MTQKIIIFADYMKKVFFILMLVLAATSCKLAEGLSDTAAELTRGEVVARFQPADAKNAKERPFGIDVKAQQTLAKEGKDCRLPLFRYSQDGAEGYVVPLHGAGLWGPIWGYVALDEDFRTVVGVSFDHKGETPGLGAKITTDDFKRQFVGKKILGPDGDFVSVAVVKNADKSSENQVDAISGATITSSGVSAMLKECLEPYRGYWGKE